MKEDKVEIISSPFPNTVVESNSVSGSVIPQMQVVTPKDSKSKNKSAKKNRLKSFCIVFSILIVVLTVGVGGGVVGVTGRDWLRTQDWYLCFRNGRCPTPNSNTNNGVKVSVSDKDQTFSSTRDVSSLYEKVGPSVVSVILEGDNSSIDQGVMGTSQPQAIASGFVVDSAKGLIVTNDHVVCTRGTYKVVTKDNKTLNVIKIFNDSADDLALIQVDVSKDKLPSELTFAKDSDQAKPGQFVVAIGNPLGDFPTTITTGVISGINRSVSASGECNGSVIKKDYDAVFQTDAPINPGNSGGPLINESGEVIGVNSATSPNASNISFSIPSNRIVRKIQEYIKYGKFQNPYLGVQHYMITPQDSISQLVPFGAYIRTVLPGSPADKGGIKSGDIIVKFGSKDVKFSLQTLISSQTVGDEVNVTVERKDGKEYKTVDLIVKLAELPSNNN